VIQVSVHTAAKSPWPGAKTVARVIKQQGQQRANRGGGGGGGGGGGVRLPNKRNVKRQRQRGGQPQGPPTAQMAAAAHWPGGLVLFVVYHKTGFALTSKIMNTLAKHGLVTPHALSFWPSCIVCLAKPQGVCVCVCVRDVKEVHTTCVDSFLRPSCLQKGRGGDRTYASEVSSPVSDVLALCAGDGAV